MKHRQHHIAKKPFKHRTLADAQKKRPDSPLSCLGDNIKTWQPGQSGNPAGRPPLTKTISDNLRKVGDLAAPPSVVRKLERESGCKMPPGITFLQAVAVKALLQSILDGDGYAREFITNRVEGSVASTLNLNQFKGTALSDDVKEKLAQEFMARKSQS